MRSLICLSQVTQYLVILHLITIEFVLKTKPFDHFIASLLLQISIVDGPPVQPWWSASAQTTNREIKSSDCLG